jgi:1,5-anhydro-D-fructose reductase (1,5-anhydro-D-mannitol-forming)
MLNWIVIGIGDIAVRRVIPAIQSEPRSRLYGLVTRDPAKAAPYQARVWPTLDEALSDPAVHAVYVATPVFLHAPQTIQSLRAGKHVLCEKPMAMNEAEARSMVQTAEETGRTFGVAYYRRAYPKVQRAKQLLEAGAIGKPVLAELTCHEWRGEKPGHRSWLLDPAQAGGGPLYDIASHRIDVLNFFFGQPSRASGHFRMRFITTRGRQCDRDDRLRRRRARHRGCSLAFEGQAGRMPHPRHRRRNGFDPLNGPELDLSRRPREHPEPRQRA